MEDALRDLIAISREVGSDPWLVQAGGGNTSAKTADGRVMFIKGSGCAMRDVDEKTGWVGVERSRVMALLDDPSLRTAPAADRERRVLELLLASVTVGEGRPSVEAPLHAVLDRVVIHSHAVAANALTCHVDGKRIFDDLVAAHEHEPAPLWVPLVKPGSPLAFMVNDMIAEYRDHHGGRRPEVVFLQNHGLFCAAPDADGCLELHRRWINRLTACFGEPATPPSAPVPDAVPGMVRSGIARAVNTLGLDPLQVCFPSAPELVSAAHDSTCEVFRGSLSPDHVVYNGPRALAVEAVADEERVRAEFAAFHAEYGVSPKLIVVSGAGIGVIGCYEKQLTAGQALAVAAVRVARMCKGRYRFMDAETVAYLMNWEVEHYRAKQVEK